MLEFELKVKCTRNPKAPKDTNDPDELYLNSKGKSKNQVLLVSEAENTVNELCFKGHKDNILQGEQSEIL